ncbi:MAG TPA: GH25 family lysozyme [Drouetiella sp.]
MTMVMSKRGLAASRLFGVDLSHYNGKVDWTKLKKSGISFAFFKASEGATLGDDQFAFNMAQARALKVPCGAYHFFIPATDVDSQVTNFCNQVGKMMPGDLAPVLDCEVPSKWITAPETAASSQVAWLALTVEQRVDKIVQWCDGVEKKLGVTPMLYASPSFISGTLGSSPRLKKYTLWIANYNVASPTIPAPFTTWAFWQDSETGTIDGVNGKVDHDYFNGTAAELDSMRYSALPLHARVAKTVGGWFNWAFGWILG